MTTYLHTIGRGKSPTAALVVLLKHTSLLTLLFLLGHSTLAAQCTFDGGQGAALNGDYDTQQTFTQTYATVNALVAPLVDITSDLTVRICFWGDMNNANETWRTTISGVAFNNIGGIGSTPTAANPFCRDFVIPEASAQADIAADGDVDITYDNFGAGWTADPMTGGSDDFNARVESVNFNYTIPTTIMGSAASSCQDGTDITFTGTPAAPAGSSATFLITPATPGFNAATGTLDVSAANPGNYIVTYQFSYEDCVSTSSTAVTVSPQPRAALADFTFECAALGQTIELSLLFDGANDAGGTWAIVDGGGSITGSTYTAPIGGDCALISYTVPNPNGCGNAPYTDQATLTVTRAPNPNFQISSSLACWDGMAPLAVNVELNSPSYMGANATRSWAVQGTNLTAMITGATTDNPSITISNPTAVLGSLQICLSETITNGCTTPTACTRQRCRTVNVSSVGCNEDCTSFQSPPDVCPIRTNSSFGFSIFGVTIDFGVATGVDIFEAPVVAGTFDNPIDPIMSCEDTEIQVSWDYRLNLPELPTALTDPIISQLGLGFLCDAAMFSIPFPSGFCGNCGPRPSPNLCVSLGLVQPCILIENLMPLGFLNFNIPGVGAICNISVQSLIIDPLQELIEQTAVAVVWADTDGDGAFDTVLESGSIVFDGSAEGTAMVPNNVQGEGTITVRNLTASVVAPYSPCVSPEGVNLLDLLPIDFIPVAGPIIRQVLTTAGIDINIAPSASTDLPIRVVNDQDPEFLNFPSEYIFSTYGECSTPVNWSPPIAVDGCTGIVIPNVAQTAGPSPGDFLTVPNPNPVVGPGNPDNNPNLYQVEYTATACNGQTLVRTFNVIVSPGEPQIVCPAPLTMHTDTDECSRVVTGITPLQGLGCNTDVTWTAPGATPAAGIGDASGTTFPLGTTTVTYFMSYVNAAGATVTEQCSFTVTIEDHQKPFASCRDVEVRLDATGQASVTVADIDGGSTDNCTAPNALAFDLARPGEAFGPTATFDCFDEGQNTVILRIFDDAEHDGDPTTDERNERRCLALVTVRDYFEEFVLNLDVPELCIETNNPEQLTFGNYLTIARPDGSVISHIDELGNGDDVGGSFGIVAYVPSIPGSGTERGTSENDPRDAGYIHPLTGVYTPGSGTGFVTISYVLGIGGQIAAGPTGFSGLEGCFVMTQDVFELRQPLEMESPECSCIVQNDRIVDLGVISGGLEPYTIQYSNVRLDIDGDGIADDVDGEFTYEGDFTDLAGNTTTFDITDFNQYLGNLLVDYTVPTWSFTVVDARGCELFRSGSCDNDDNTAGPEILCENLGPVDLFTEEFACQAFYAWPHTLPTDNCDVILYTYTITNPDGSIAGPFDLTALLNPDITNPLPDQFIGRYNFQHHSPTENVSIVTYYAEDAVGNFVQCSFEVSVTDNVAPRFINCPEPAVIVDAPALWCSAFANYSLPLATDNCDIPVVTQVDETGLTSGDLYPVGITINTFEAVDATGNTTRCDVKIIVNDFHTPPTFNCPADVATDNDEGDCGAIVNGIAPTAITDNCLDNLTIVYRIDDAQGNELASGFDDASGTFFDLGTSTVSYAIQDMPLLLITEITHDISNPVDGTNPLPLFTAGNAATADYLEITNFNRANLDVSCLMVERLHAGGSDVIDIPTFTILAPGQTLTIHFGDGLDAPADRYFNVAGAADLAANEPAAYILSLSRSILDVAVINGYNINGLMPPAYNLGGLTIADYWSGTISPVYGSGIVRTTVWDTDTAADFAPGEACLPTTIGALNPGLAQPTPNGASTAIQAQPTVRVECGFTVTVADAEPAVCGLYSEWNDYTGGPITIGYGECIETVIPVADLFNVADVNLNLEGLVGDLGNITITLISPEGTAIELADAVCAGTDAIEFTFDGDFGPAIDAGCGILNNAGQLVMPIGDIEAFNGEAVNGDWILQIGHNGQENTTDATITSFILFISAREAYPDYTTTLENDFRLCGATYSWFHPILFDNCPGGGLEMQITYADGSVSGLVEVDQTLEIFPENTEFTHFFQVGVTTVNYTLTDAAGNVSTCSFDVTVLDTEDPRIVCPADVTIQLNGGECDVIYIPTDWTAIDNCAVVDTISNPNYNLPLPIGINEVDLTIVDAAGNDTTCTYIVTVLEYIPNPPQMACIGDINISLTNTCQQTIIPSMVLAGNEYYCFDTYVVTLLQENANGVPVLLPSNTVGLDQVGDRIIYQVYDPRNDILCWGYVNVGFYEAPDFICPADTTIHCNASTDTALMGAPVLLSCALIDATVTFADTLQRLEVCGDPRAILRRTWTVADNFGNASSCVQTITIAAFDLDAIVFPPDFDGVNNAALNCVDVANNASLTEPIFTGFPTVLGGSNIFQDNFCSAAYLYTDEVYNICAGSYEILRTWKVRNTCMPVIPGVNPREAIQLIRVLDAENPQLSCPENVTVSTGPFDCEGVYLIPPPVVEANCSNYTYEVSVSAGTLNRLSDGSYTLANLQQGTYSIRYEVEDECGRYSECIYFITVVDEVDATAICENGLNVSLDGNGQAILLAEDVDGGSDDLCGSVDLAIRRLVINEPNNCSLLGTSFFTDWGPSIALNCCDLDSLVTVELLVTDEQGNQSVCWTNILVEDKLAPVCLPPPSMFITCLDLADNFPNDLSAAFDTDPVTTAALLNQLFGEALAGDNCGNATISQTVVDARTSCGIGLIQRRFRATDEQGLISPPNCLQNITVRAVHDYTIILPADQSSDICAIPDYSDLVIEDNGCGLFNISTRLDTFFATADECYKLQITYEIINWCEYNGEEDPYIIPRDADEDNNLEEETFLHILPRSFNTIEDDVAVLSRTQDRSGTNLIALLDRDDVGQDGFAGLGGVADGASLTNGYGLDGSRGHFRYRQFIKVYDNVAPVITAEDLATPVCDEDGDCVADVPLSFSVVDGCSPEAVQVSISLDRFREDRNGDGIFTLADFVADGGLIQTGISRDSAGNYSLLLPGLPFGEHAIRISANDGCGNTSVDLLLFEVVDCKAPTPICINGLTVTLMPDGSGDGMAAIWASDYIASEVTDCSGEVRYAIYTDEMATAADFAGPNPVDTGLVFTCADVGLQVVRIYAIDPVGRADYCETTLDVQRFSPNLCDGSAGGFLAGFIHTPSANPMANVSVSLAGGTAGAMSSMTSNDTDETGAFLFEALPYGLDYTVVPTHNPAINLARITTADLILISRHILGLQPLTSNYQLLAADVTQDQFINVVDIINIRRVILGLATAYTASPSWRFYAADGTEVYNANNLQSGILDANFTAVEMGNVSDAIANAQQGNSRTEAEIRLDDQQLLAGETYTVRFESAHLAGYQATLSLAEGLELLDIDFSSDQATGFNLEQAANGLLAVSHIGDSSFALRVRAARNARLSELLQLSDRITPSEAYTLDGNTADLRLSFRSLLDQGRAFSLEQNVPNPFEGSTKIDFFLPENSPATLTVQDIQGRVILVRSLDGSAGHNSFVLQAEALKGAKGVLFYSLVAGQHTATRKMVVVQ